MNLFHRHSYLYATSRIKGTPPNRSVDWIALLKCISPFVWSVGYAFLPQSPQSSAGINTCPTCRHRDIHSESRQNQGL